MRQFKMSESKYKSGNILIDEDNRGIFIIRATDYSYRYYYLDKPEWEHDVMRWSLECQKLTVLNA